MGVVRVGLGWLGRLGELGWLGWLGGFAGLEKGSNQRGLGGWLTLV